jgi:predicted metalloprotease
MSCVTRLVALLVVLSALAVAQPGRVMAQDQPPLTGDAAAAAETARELSRLEAARDFAALYGLMHPDSKAVVPEAAVVGWYEADFAGKRTAELTVTGVEFGPWTWPVTGETYPRTAAVAFVQPYWIGGVRQDAPGVVHLVEADDGEWGWFFGNDRAWVEQQIALYESAAAPAPDPEADTVPVNFVSAFPHHLDAHVDRFWAGAFAARDRPYDPPDDLVGFDGPIRTDCGWAAPREVAAFYCPADETIYYAVAFRALVESQVGDFGWVTVVAHEWGHHVQAELGLLEEAARDPDDAEDGALLPIELELQADCLAGAYTRDAERVEWLDPGDIEEALFLTGVAGDPAGTAWTDPEAHGSERQRVAAFLAGYEAGIGGCGLPI